jgi:7-carboxy-7-deazaguanine synthase
MLNVNSIFYTIQGEGQNTGMPMVFVRLQGCNLRCSFCDTEFLSGLQMEEHQILEELKKYNSKNICITGGEPLIQNIDFFVKLLKYEKYYVAVETNGTKKLSDYCCNNLNFVAVSPKPPRRLIIQRADEIKFIIDGGEEVPNLISYKQKYSDAKLYVSPMNPSSGKPIGTKTASFFDFINC